MDKDNMVLGHGLSFEHLLTMVNGLTSNTSITKNESHKKQFLGLW
jgi:hypothetical protein